MTLKNISRRHFLSASLAGSGAIMALSQKAKSARSEKELTARRDKTVIKVVYMAKPVPTWPCPHIDINAEMQKINNVLTTLQKKSDRNIEFTGKELVRTAEDMPGFARTISDIDGILAFNLTSTCGPMFRPIVDLGYPTVLFSQPYSGHDWSSVAGLQKQGKRVDIVSSSDFDDLEPVLRIFDAIRRTRQSAILCLRPHTEKNKAVRSLEEHYGLTIHVLNYDELKTLYGQSDTKKAAQLADAFINGAVRMVEPGKKDVVESMRLYLAINELLARYGSNVITIDCLGGFRRNDLPAYPCVSWTLLNNEGRIGVCEADLDSTVTQIMLQYLTGKPGFVSDPVIDTKTNTVIHAHCVSATKMDGPRGAECPYIIRSHMEDNKGVSVQVKMRVGQEITLAKLINCTDMLISTGKIIDNPEGERGCRTKVTTTVSDANELLHNYTGGLHRLMVYGNHVDEIQKMGYLMGFKLQHEF